MNVPLKKYMKKNYWVIKFWNIQTIEKRPLKSQMLKPVSIWASAEWYPFQCIYQIVPRVSFANIFFTVKSLLTYIYRLIFAYLYTFLFDVILLENVQVYMCETNKSHLIQSTSGYPKCVGPKPFQIIWRWK